MIGITDPAIYDSYLELEWQQRKAWVDACVADGQGWARTVSRRGWFYWRCA